MCAVTHRMLYMVYVWRRDYSSTRLLCNPALIIVKYTLSWVYMNMPGYKNV